MKILVLFDLAHPTDPNESFSPETLKEEDKPTEADVLESLRRLGHEAETLAVYDNVTGIVEKLKAFAPDVVFNLSESFYHDRAHEPNITALLDLMRVRYTGSGSDALLLCKDKALAKKVLAYHRVRLPHFVVSHRAHPLRRLRRFQYPAFVKPVCEDASDGICRASFAKDEKEAIERARFIHQKFNCDALIEEYIEGRELYLSDQMPEDAPKFATFRAKWNDAYRAKWGIKNGPAQPLPEGVQAHLTELARKVYRLLKIRGFGRIDVRLTPAGEVYVIEANPNPCLAQDEDFAQSACLGGVGYDTLVQEILNTAFA
jgi:D-alanine-D-alanine ligase